MGQTLYFLRRAIPELESNENTGSEDGHPADGRWLASASADSDSHEVDLFRIRIWDKDSNDAIGYNNHPGDSVNATPTTEIGGGSIVVHKYKKK